MFKNLFKKLDKEESKCLFCKSSSEPFKKYIISITYVKPIDTYETFNRLVITNDIYHEIGRIYCNSLFDVISIDYICLEEKYEKK